MRITDNIRFNTTVNNLFNAQSQYNDLMEKMVSQKKVNRASDSPVAATKIIDLRQGIAANEQYRKNITDSDAWISMTESKLSGAYDLLVKAREIALGMVTATANAAGRKIAAQEVQSLIDEMAGLANAKHGDRYLFSGSKNGTIPFLAAPGEPSIEAAEKAGNNAFEGTAVSSGTYLGTSNKTYVLKITREGSLAAATAQISSDGGRTWNGTDLDMDGGAIALGDGVVLTFDDAAGAETFGVNDIFIVNATAEGYYRGNDDPLSLTINRGMDMTYNITGAEAFTAAGQTGIDIFATLNDLKEALAGNDVQGISGQLENLKKAQDQITLNQSRCGTKASHIEMAKNNLDILNEKLISLLSETQDADLAEFATRLSIKEVALQASYAMAAKIGDTTILNFLK
jgi:flagellar hook-associated protein 3 FlgL